MVKGKEVYEVLDLAQDQKRKRSGTGSKSSLSVLIRRDQTGTAQIMYYEAKELIRIPEDDQTRLGKRR